jgi:hypothetical protein
MTKRILVIEDQEDLRDILRDLLTRSGYVVIEAQTGRPVSPAPNPTVPTSSTRPPVFAQEPGHHNPGHNGRSEYETVEMRHPPTSLGMNTVSWAVGSN